MAGTPLVVGVSVTWIATANLNTAMTNAVDTGAAMATPGTTAGGNSATVTLQ